MLSPWLMLANGPTLRSWIGEHAPSSAQPVGSSTCVSLSSWYFLRSSSRAVSPGRNDHQRQLTVLFAMLSGVTPRSFNPAQYGSTDARQLSGYGGARQ